jgi:hypothetical protein
VRGRFPILLSWEEKRDHPDFPRSVPWSFVAPHAEQAERNHCGQTLERLAERGGLDPSEMVAVVTGVAFRDIAIGPAAQAEARRRLLEMLVSDPNPAA